MGLKKFFKKGSKDNLPVLFLIFGNIVGQQDGYFSDKETEYCLKFLKDRGFNGEEITEIYNQIPKTDHKEALSMGNALNEDDKFNLIVFLMGLAESDGNFDAREAMSIASIANQIGLDGSKIIKLIVDQTNLTDKDIVKAMEEGPLKIHPSLSDEGNPLKEAMNLFKKNIEGIEYWYEIIQKRGEFIELYCKKNDVEPHDFHFFGEQHAIEYLKKYDKNEMGIEDINERIEIFNKLIFELKKIIEKAKELNINVSQALANDFYAAQSSLKGAELGYIMMAARGESINIIKLREIINGPDSEHIDNHSVLNQAKEINKKLTKSNNWFSNLFSW